MNKTKTYIIAALAAALSVAANAAPLSPAISGPTSGIGSYGIVGNHSNAKVAYQVSFDSVFGGHWNLSGTHTEPGYHGQQYFEDSFSGTISNTSLKGTFTSADFSWLIDVYLYCLPPISRMIQAKSFTINISGGKVSGTATY